MHIIVWEFTVRPERLREFAEAYGAEGAWAELFRRGRGYLGTELLQDTTTPHRFVTIDRWESEGDYVAFQQECGEEYRALDVQLEGMTTAESRLGALTQA